MKAMERKDVVERKVDTEMKGRKSVSPMKQLDVEGRKSVSPKKQLDKPLSNLLSTPLKDKVSGTVMYGFL